MGVILVDMDGVIANFHEAACKLHGRMDCYPPDRWAMEEQMGLTRTEFWQPIQQAGTDFWYRGIKPYTWTWELLGRLRDYTIATSPGPCPWSPTGKALWLRAWLGRTFDKYMIGKQKHLMANPNTVLIDDSDINIQRFRRNGGIGILFPQPWNANAGITNRVEYVTQELGRVWFLWEKKPENC